MAYAAADGFSGALPGKAATSGIHRATDALEMLMAGADVTMLRSVLLRRGIGHIAVIEREMLQWSRAERGKPAARHNGVARIFTSSR